MQIKPSSSPFCSCGDRDDIFARLYKKTLNVRYGTKNLAVFLFNQIEFEVLCTSRTSYIYGFAQKHIDSPVLFYSYSLKGPGPTRYSALYRISLVYQWYSINQRSARCGKYVRGFVKIYAFKRLTIWLSSI